MSRSRVALCLSLAAIARCGGDEPDDSAAPSELREPAASLLLVTLDTTRADRIGAYGRADAGTPHLDALAREGVRFLAARSAAPLTLPSHATILTGAYPSRHGIHDNGVASLTDEAETLAEVLARHGAHTAAFVGAMVLSARFGIGQGFDHFDELPGFRVESGSLMVERPADAVAGKAIEWLQSVEPPFFAWVHLFDPHHPYEPPKPFAAAHPDDPYQGEISFADAQVGRLVEAARAVDPAVLICVTADHGEGLGDHGEPTHGPFLYDSTMRVPLLLAGPLVPAGLSIEDAVSTADIAPTLAELLCASALPRADGVSLVPILKGEPLRRDPVLMETYWPYLHHGWSPLVAAADGPRKWIEGPDPELYRVDRDPGEREDLSGDAGEVRAASTPREAARRYHRDEGEWARSHVLSPHEREALRQLGYTGSTATAALPAPGGDLANPMDRIHLVRLRDEALELLQRFDATWPRDGAPLMAAIEMLEAGLREDPEDPALQEALGLALFRLGRHADALAYLRRGAASDPSNVDTRLSIALSLIALDERDAALEELETILSIAPDMARAWQLKGLIHQQQGRPEQAVAAYERFLELWPANDPQAAGARRVIEMLRTRMRQDSGRRGADAQGRRDA